MSACAACLARPWLLARLAGHLDRVRDRALALLELDNAELIAALGGTATGPSWSASWPRSTPPPHRRRAAPAGVELICRCADGYPAQLAALAAPPAVLHVAGRPAAVPGTGRPQPGGDRGRAPGVALRPRRRARLWAEGWPPRGLTVVSGMARGIDAAAHQGALAGAGDTLAVLPAAAELPYPASARALHRRIVDAAAAVSELPPGTGARRWMFPARNRIIAALERDHRRGRGAASTPARCSPPPTAAELGRPVGAVPGQITSPLAAGPHGLLRARAPP